MNTRHFLLILLALSACLRAAEDRAPAQSVKDESGWVEADAPPPPPAAAPPAEDESLGLLGGRMEAKKRARPSRPDRGGGGAREEMAANIAEAEAPKPESPAPEEPAAPTRSWFPESFLFEPRVVTDDQGRAIVEAKVPDRLTSWRVLALAHTRSGLLGGAVTKFLGTLPIYAEPIVPRFLYAGDEVQAPLQIVNTTERAVSASLLVTAGGSGSLRLERPVSLGPSASMVVPLSLRADRAGELQLRASLGKEDAVEERIEVRPAGRAITVEKGGTLAAPREVTLETPADALADGAKVRLTVFPGALALLRTELATALTREGPAEDAYALLLAGRAPELASRLGGEVDPEALRNLAILAGQRAIRHARAPSLEVARLFAEPALAHPDRPVLARLGERLVGQLTASQRPDGTFGGETGWTLQRLMMLSAESLRVVAAASPAAGGAKSRAEAARLRASAAFERNLGRIEDPYTAATILVSGGVSGTVADELRRRVREAVVTRDDGARILPVGPGVVRADGQSPTELEATAIAALALAQDSQAPWVADLGAAVLGGYHPGSGWGDGQTNLSCLRAVLDLFKDPLPSEVRITALLDGAPIAEGVLDTKRIKDLMVLEAPLARPGGLHRYSLRAEPAVPGLGFLLSARVFVPWKAGAGTGGLELEIERRGELRVGLPIELTLVARAPAGRPLRIVHRLPAGVSPDGESLDALVAAGTITRHALEEGAITLDVPPLTPGATFTARYRAVPTLAGRLLSGPSELAITGSGGENHEVPPERWTIR
ncbi:MAG: hypothetical protein IT384_11710 [Deltaproteobacteria bacterium]|nr:hypothetical protein [Deltaproteobacteria bacterium]